MTEPGWVTVELVQGEYSCTGGTADLFTKDTLTISDQESGIVLKRFSPDHWLACVVYDPRGNPLFAFENTEAERLRAHRVRQSGAARRASQSPAA